MILPITYRSSLYLFLFLGLSSIISCKRDGNTFPRENWSFHQNPEELGWKKESLHSFKNYLKDSTVLTGLLIIHKGKIAFEYGNITENSYIASCRKSILAILYGKHVQNGTIDLSKTLSELEISDTKPLLPIEQKATVRDLLSAKSGVYLPGANGGDFRKFAPERGAVIPGEYWLYNNWDFNVAGYIFEKETGTTIYKELESQLTIPLQMQDWDPALQRKSGDSAISKFPAYHMWLSTRDMARIGLLMLHRGRWNDKQLIPQFWIDEITKQHTSYSEAQKNVPLLKKDGLDLGYGYMWWLLENMDDIRFRNAFSAQGAMGQNITIFPEIDVVLAFKTHSRYRKSNSIQTQMNIIKKTVTMYGGI